MCFIELKNVNINLNKNYARDNRFFWVKNNNGQLDVDALKGENTFVISESHNGATSKTSHHWLALKSLVPELQSPILKADDLIRLIKDVE